MPEYIKALIYVIAVAVPALLLANRLASPLIASRELGLWQGSWLAATVFAFLSRDFMVFIVLMSLLSLFIHLRSKEPAALYIVLLFSAPCLAVGIGIPGVFNRVLDLNLPRLLSLSLLLPVAIGLWSEPSNRSLRGVDLPAIGFWALLTALAARQDDIASVLRLPPGYFLDILLPYFVFSRIVCTRQHLDRVLTAIVVAALPLAAIGMFEFWRSWRVYYVVVLEWDIDLITPYLFRDGLLRAAVTAIEPIAFGFLCMVAAASAISITDRRISSRWRSLTVLLLLGGLGASISRGPWLGFALFVLVVLLSDSRARRTGMLAITGLLMAIYLLPMQVFERLFNLLPFVGSADRGSETYRERLFEQSLLVIQRQPLLGSKDFIAAPELQVLVQGQGIIDIVNSYLQVVLEFGLFGLALFVSVFAVLGGQLAVRWLRRKDEAAYYQGLLGLIVAIVFTIATTSSVSFIAQIYWVSAGMIAGLLRRPEVLNPAPDAERVGRDAPALQGIRVLGRGI
ncbi:O-antigen ligase domain-containing protein [Pseudorhizobium halotolerans]|uniref:O-antigen ligase domain-containing protein n=2 Tax=Pseudorhizobium halotolerans TaxID=1233081 RepID=A0ABN7JX25_9HYPH|nr:O-antigen ligase domain-containing protein [Pseudorhizobium halotolerans]